MFKEMAQSTTNSVWSILLPFVFVLSSYLVLKMSGLSLGRSSLVNSLVSKMEAERSLEQMDRGLWYKVDLAKIRDQENIASKFVQLSEDEATSAFIKHSFEQSDWLFTQLYYNFAKSLLSWFYCQTDINGILARGSMFVFSKEQFLLLSSSISPPSFTPSSTLPALLDLGSGDGRPTTSLSPFFDQTFVTEVSRPMQKQCTARGFKVLELDEWAKEANKYDVISALNLFDRCDRPITIIKDIHYSLKPSGLLVVALVLPFRPYVESVPSHKPTERMAITGERFEEQVESAVKVFENEGFELKSWSRVPYLCEGDLNKPLYHLNNGLFVFKPKSKA